MPLDFNRRAYGERVKTESNLTDVPLPRREPSREGAQVVGSPPPSAPLNDDYERDTRATSPLASLPRDVQEQAVRARAIYEIAAHPGATQFEIDLAHALMDDLAPKEQKAAQQPGKEGKENGR